MMKCKSVLPYPDLESVPLKPSMLTQPIILFCPLLGASHFPEFCANYSLLIFMAFNTFVYLQKIWYYLILPSFEHHINGIILHVFNAIFEIYS